VSLIANSLQRRGCANRGESVVLFVVCTALGRSYSCTVDVTLRPKYQLWGRKL